MFVFWSLCVSGCHWLLRDLCKDLWSEPRVFLTTRTSWTLISSSWRPGKQFLIHLNFHFQKRPCPAPRDGERGLLSMPWIDEVCIKPDIERSSILEKHLNLCNICVRILSNVTLVKTFSNLSRDYFRWIMISVNHISFHCFGNNYLSCIFYRYLWVMASWGAGSRGPPWLHAITSGQVTAL